MINSLGHPLLPLLDLLEEVVVLGGVLEVRLQTQRQLQHPRPLRLHHLGNIKLCKYHISDTGNQFYAY